MLVASLAALAICFVKKILNFFQSNETTVYVRCCIKAASPYYYY